MKEILERLCAGQDLSEEQSHRIFSELFAGNLSEVELSALLIALKIKGECAAEVSGAARAMLEAAAPLERPAGEVGEIVGTGGDGLHTFNISTITAILASCMGMRIAKHGNRAVSSSTGASDVLSELGYNVTAPAALTARLLAEEGFAFIFAQSFHKAMKYAAPVRQKLQTRTIFNLLGPLTSPAHPDYELLGVYDAGLTELMARTLQQTGVRRALCVNGQGMDEITCCGTTHVSELHADGSITSYDLTPQDFGITQSVSPEELRGGDPQANAAIARSVLSGQGTPAQQLTVGVNLAALAYLSGQAASLRDGFEQGMACIRSGQGLAKLERICRRSREE